MSFRELAKKIAFRTPALSFLSRPRYPYNLTPSQLAFLVSALDRTRGLAGNIVELGVARGMTTYFLNHHMSLTDDPRKYLCIDTFSGFVESDIAHEKRRKESEKNGPMPTFAEYAYGEPEIFRKNMQEFGRVTVIQKDVNLLKLSDVGAVSLALLDVDLYFPTKRALPILFDALLPAGVIMVDDCKMGDFFDGAGAVYQEFCKEHHITPKIIGTKGGIIEKSP